MTIKEIEELAGMPRANIRYYEAEGLVSPTRSENGYRDYSKEDLSILKKIKLLRSLHMSMEEIKALHTGEQELSVVLEQQIKKLSAEKENLDKAQNGDYVVVTKLDRFCRTTKEGLEYIDLLLNKGVKIHILNMDLIESSPMGRLIVTNLLAFAEFERAMIIEHTRCSKAIAKQRADFKEGRPKKYNTKKINHALDLLESYSYKQVEELTGMENKCLSHKKVRGNNLNTK